MEYVLMIIPVVFLIGSVLLAVRAVKRGTKAKTAIMSQMIAFFCVCIICVATPMAVSAASNDNLDENTTTTSETAKTSEQGVGFGMGLLAAAIVTSLSGIGGGIAVAASAPAAIAATAEDSKSFGKSLIFVALGEGIALYGLLVSILILAKI